MKIYFKRKRWFGIIKYDRNIVIYLWNKNDFYKMRIFFNGFISF